MRALLLRPSSGRLSVRRRRGGSEGNSYSGDLRHAALAAAVSVLPTFLAGGGGGAGGSGGGAGADSERAISIGRGPGWRMSSDYYDSDFSCTHSNSSVQGSSYASLQRGEGGSQLVGHWEDGQVPPFPSSPLPL